MTKMTDSAELLQPLAAGEPLADAAAVIDEGLEDALSLLHADRGNVQIVDPITGSLRIAAQAGFSDEFLEYFAVVNDDGSACGRAAQDCAQTVIIDVDADGRFAPHRQIAAASGFRAVQSTPLLDRHGNLLGMLSTHYSSPYCPPEEDLELTKRLGGLMGQAVEACLEEDSRDAVDHFEELVSRRVIKDAGVRWHGAAGRGQARYCGRPLGAPVPAAGR